MSKKILFLFAFLVCILCNNAQDKAAIDKLVKELDLPADDTTRIVNLINLGIKYQRIGLVDSSYRILHEALKIGKKHTFNSYLGTTTNYLAWYYNYKGIQDSALYYYSQSIKFHEAAKDSSDVAGVYNNIGNVYNNLGNVEKALEYYYKSLSLKEKMGDQEAIATSCTMLGHLYHSFNDSANAIKFLNRALKIREEMKDSIPLANLFVIMGNYYREIGNVPKAEKLIKKGLDILAKTEDEEGYAIANYNYGTILFFQKRYGDAIPYFMVAYKLAAKNGDPEGIASCLEMLGEVSLEDGKYKEAAHYLEDALKSAEVSHIPELISNIHVKLSKAYEKQNLFEKALYHYKKGDQINDTLFTKNNIKKLTETELKYQHEKERLLLVNEQEQKEIRQKSESFRKNIILFFAVLLLVVVLGFSIVLFKRFRTIKSQKDLIQQQNQEILDSIKYAKRIQNALLANIKLINANIRESFILFKPRNLVSGDFYWAVHTNHDDASPAGRFYLAVCDSTGHGVPGAFMSLLNTGFLNEAIIEKRIKEPGDIFNHVRKRLVESMKEDDQKDGMDALLLCFDIERRLITYSAANNQLVIVRNNEIIELPYDKMPVGKGEINNPFRNFELNVEAEDMVYLCTDGFADQFGGPRGKKFLTKQLHGLLIQISSLSMDAQEVELETRFEEWRGKLEQVDDVCVFGFRI